MKTLSALLSVSALFTAFSAQAIEMKDTCYQLHGMTPSSDPVVCFKGIHESGSQGPRAKMAIFNGLDSRFQCVSSEGIEWTPNDFTFHSGNGWELHLRAIGGRASPAFGTLNSRSGARQYKVIELKTEMSHRYLEEAKHHSCF